jgi:hypothetical protein
LGDFIHNHYEGKVAVLASGSFSGDIGGPKMGSVNTSFDKRFVDWVAEGKPEEMIRSATPEIIERAGVANEILVWITLLGMMGSLKPSFTEYACESGWSTAATLATWHPETRW